MNTDQQKLDSSLASVIKASKALYVITMVLGALFSIIFFVALAAAIVQISQGIYFDASSGISVFVPAIWSALLAIGTYIVACITKEVSQGKSPFTVKNAGKIRLLSFLFLLSVVLEIISSSGFLAVTVGAFTLYSSTYPILQSGNIPIDIFALVASLACFTLSVVWHYGALLQSQSDDLV